MQHERTAKEFTGSLISLMPSIQKEYFDQPDLWNRPLTGQEKERLRLVYETWPAGVKSVLEVGCGSGNLLNGVTWGPECVGLDYSIVAAVQVKWPVIQGDISDLPFVDNQFDLVICSDVLEHIPLSKLDAAVSEVKRCSKEHILILSPINEDLFQNQVTCRTCKCSFHPNGHIHSFSRRDLQTRLLPEFNIQRYTYLGDAWRHTNLIATALERTWDSEAPSIDEAMCPQCGQRQGDLLASNTPDGLKADIAWFKHIGDAASEEFLDCEVLLWLKKDVESPEETPQQTKRQLWVRTEENCSRLELCCTDRGLLNMSTPVSAVVPNATYQSILIINERTDWGDLVEDPDGGLCRMFEDCGVTDGHVVWAFPRSLVRQRRQMRVGIRDLNKEQCYIQVFLSYSGYHTLGSLGGTGDGRWKESVFDLDRLAPLSDNVILFRIITQHPHPPTPLPVGRIALLPESIETSNLEVNIDSYGGLEIEDILFNDNAIYTFHSNISVFELFGHDDLSKTGEAFLGRGKSVVIPKWYWLESVLREPSEVGDDNNTISRPIKEAGFYKRFTAEYEKAVTERDQLVGERDYFLNYCRLPEARFGRFLRRKAKLLID